MDREREMELVGRAREGKEDAFRELLEDNLQRVYSLALHYTNRHEDADEIAQETFIRAHRALGHFRAEAWRESSEAASRSISARTPFSGLVSPSSPMTWRS